jgi:STE24 endopeptidase
VVAHELAHAKHDDVLVGTAIGAGVALAAAGLLGVLVGRRFDRLTDPGAVPALLALFALAGALALPVQNAMSRAVETRADVDALRTTGDGPAFVSLQRQLALGALQDPSPPAVSQAWFGSHPTPLQRIALVQRILP